MSDPQAEALAKHVRTALALADHTARTGEKTTGRYANVMRRGFESLRTLAALTPPATSSGGLDADGDPIRPDPHSEDWYDGYANGQRDCEAARLTKPEEKE